MGKLFKKIDWVQVGVLALGITATVAKSIYEAKKFDANLAKQTNDHFDKKVNELIDAKLKKLK